MRRFLLLLCLLISPAGLASAQSRPATFRTANFVCTMANATDAKNVAEWAEYYRVVWARAWLGHDMPAWSHPCPIRARNLAAANRTCGGATTFAFTLSAEPMSISLDGPGLSLTYDALPHEITHTVLAHAIGRPIPRWIDEGAATLSETEGEQQNRFQDFVRGRQAGRYIPLARLFEMRDYPRDVGQFYSQSAALCRYLVDLGGRGKLLELMKTGPRGWDAALARLYSIGGTAALERDFNAAFHLPQQAPVQQWMQAPVLQGAPVGQPCRT